MSIHCDTHFDVLDLLPGISIANIKCDHCDESHGIAIAFAWLFWAIVITTAEEQQ